MNRKQFLQRLLQKADQGRYHDYVRVHLSQTMQEESPPATIKRMQILQMGCGRINASLPKNSQNNKEKGQRCNDSNITQSNSSRKVFILQKGRSPYEKKTFNHNLQDMPACIQKNIKTRNNQLTRQLAACLMEQNQQIKKVLIKTHASDPRVIDCIQNNKNNKTMTTSAQSPLRRGPQSNTFRTNKNIANINTDNKNISCSNGQLIRAKKSTISQLINKVASSSIPTPRPFQVEQQRFTNQLKIKQFTISQEYVKNTNNKDNLTQNYNNLHKPITNQSNSQSFQRKYVNSNRKIINKKVQQEVNRNYQRNMEIEKQNKILFRQQINKNYGKPFNPPPKLSAKSYIVVQQIVSERVSEISHTNSTKFGLTAKNFSSNIKTNRSGTYTQGNAKNKKQKQLAYFNNIKVHAAFNSKNSVEVASLTKIMTCIVAIQICLRFDLNSKQQEIKIGKFQSNIGGTSAKIEEGDIYTLDDLLYGLMLPSGNDASLAIAVWGGRKLLDHQKDENDITRRILKKQSYERFLRQMNNKAKQLQMTKTNYANSHGLINTLNRSCAYDIACLSIYAMKNQYFRKIVSTKYYTKTIKTEIKQQKQINDFQEENNKVQDQYQSIKSKISEKDNYKSLKVNVDTKKDISNSKEYQEESDEDELSSDQESQKQKNDRKTKMKYQHKKHSFQKDRISHCKSSFEGPASSQVISNQISKSPTKSYKYIIGQRVVEWQNTHKLLHKKESQYIGIKTGVTTAAGPCLSSCVVTQCGRSFFIVVLNCKKMLSRFKQTDILKKWIFKQETIRVGGKKTRPTSAKTYSNSIDVEVQQEMDSGQQDLNINQNQD